MAFAVSAFVAGALLPLVYAQQFEDRTYPYDILGVGEQCFEALNSTVIGCSWILHRQTGLYVEPRLNGEHRRGYTLLPPSLSHLA